MCDAGGHSSEKARHGRKRHRAVHLPHGTRALVGRRHTAGAFEAPGARSLGRLAPPRGHVVVAAPRVGRRRLEELGGRREHGGVDLGHVDQAVHAALEVLERGDARVGDGSGLVGALDGLGRRRPDRALDLPLGHALGAAGSPVAHLLLDVRADPRLGPPRPVLDEQSITHLANYGHVEPVINARAKRAADDLDLVVARGAPLLDGGDDWKPPALVANLGDEVDGELAGRAADDALAVHLGARDDARAAHRGEVEGVEEGADDAGDVLLAEVRVEGVDAGDDEGVGGLGELPHLPVDVGEEGGLEVGKGAEDREERALQGLGREGDGGELEKMAEPTGGGPNLEGLHIAARAVAPANLNDVGKYLGGDGWGVKETHAHAVLDRIQGRPDRQLDVESGGGGLELRLPPPHEDVELGVLAIVHGDLHRRERRELARHPPRLHHEHGRPPPPPRRKHRLRPPN